MTRSQQNFQTTGCSIARCRVRQSQRNPKDTFHDRSDLPRLCQLWITDASLPRRKDLIYRGVCHDGLTAQAPAPTRSIAMRYRGVAYTLANGAARSDTATVTAAIDQIVPAHAVA